MAKYVYLFSEGNSEMRELLGEREQIFRNDKPRFAVPEGFTVTTEACMQYYKDNEQISDEIQAQILEYMGKLEGVTVRIGTKRTRCWYQSDRHVHHARHDGYYTQSRS